MVRLKPTTNQYTFSFLQRFNSSMVRLKHPLQQSDAGKALSFNSSMVRLKPVGLEKNIAQNQAFTKILSASLKSKNRRTGVADFIQEIDDIIKITTQAILPHLRSRKLSNQTKTIKK